jgi:hypothetical protein
MECTAVNCLPHVLHFCKIPPPEASVTKAVNALPFVLRMIAGAVVKLESSVTSEDRSILV